MDILYLLIPLSAVLALMILGVFGWAVNHGQFEDLEHEGERILDADEVYVDARQGPGRGISEESRQTVSHL